MRHLRGRSSNRGYRAEARSWRGRSYRIWPAVLVSLPVFAVLGCGSGGAAAPPPTTTPAPVTAPPATAATAPAAGAPGAGGVLAKPIDPTQLTDVPFGSRSHWLQPWRSYLDTVPATRLLGAVGINFDVPATEADATAKLLAAAHFRRARLEIPWGAVDFADHAKLDNLADVRTKLLALKAAGIRPLILLNANDSKPGPSKSLTLTLVQPAQQGDRTVVLDAASAAAVVPGRTGLDAVARKGKGRLPAGILVTSVAADGTATLSRPLAASAPAGPYKATTLAYAPFQAPLLKGGAPNPAFEDTLRGWLDYVGLVTRTAQSILGSQSFDVEIWNELTFGSAFLKAENYYAPTPKGSGSVTDAILARTVAYLRDPANGVQGIGIGDGFANTAPWPAGSTSPPGLTAIDKHPYPHVIAFPATAGKGTPVDALGRPDASGFTPTYTAFFPEYALTAIQTESVVRDLAPVTTEIKHVAHGRAAAPRGGAAPTVWVTETNMDPAAAQPGLAEAVREHLQAKAELRTLVSFVNKGVTALDFYDVRSPKFGLLHPGPGGGATLQAIARLIGAFGHVAALPSTRPLALLSVGDHHNHAEFPGDGTPAHPPLYDRDVVAFLPFQATPTRYVVPVYVMTRNIASVQVPSAAATDPARYDLPAEHFQIAIGGLPGAWKLSLYDPLANSKLPVTVLARSGSRLTVDLPLTDSPRLLTITR